MPLSKLYKDSINFSKTPTSVTCYIIHTSLHTLVILKRVLLVVELSMLGSLLILLWICLVQVTLKLIGVLALGIIAVMMICVFSGTNSNT